MSDCTGYGFNTSIDLIVSGAIRGQTRTRLSVVFLRSQFFLDTTFTVDNWTGTRLVLDVTSAIRSGTGFGFVGCSTLSASLEIIPDNGGTTGNMVLEYVLDDCASNADPYNAFVNCGGVGPHTVTAMMPYTLVEGTSSCPI